MKITTIKFPKIKNVTFYLVGGSVRDYLMGQPNKDLDFVAVTNYSFDILLCKIKKKGKVYLSKKEFLTIRCSLDDEDMDIALPRSDGNYDDKRHPNKVYKVNTLKEDAARRDFTINTLYMSEDGKITDHYNGHKDIRKGIIRCVGDPYDRLSEDYLRILRGIRFAIQLKFKIESKTFFAMIECSKHLDEVHPERMKIELNKALIINPAKTIVYLKQLGIFKILMKKGLNLQFTNKKIKR